jgi:hypothetical protein
MPGKTEERHERSSAVSAKISTWDFQNTIQEFWTLTRDFLHKKFSLHFGVSPPLLPLRLEQARPARIMSESWFPLDATLNCSVSGARETAPRSTVCNLADNPEACAHSCASLCIFEQHALLTPATEHNSLRRSLALLVSSRRMCGGSTRTLLSKISRGLDDLGRNLSLGLHVQTARAHKASYLYLHFTHTPSSRIP